MKRYFFIYGLIFLFFSCSKYKKSEFEKAVEFKYNSICKKSNRCTIYISDAIPYNWDKMFVFKSTASLEIINKALGFNYPYFEDVAERVVFVKGNKVVYHDDYHPTFDDDIYTSIVFNLPNGVSYQSFKPDDAIFNIEKKEIENKQTYFVLSQ